METYNVNWDLDSTLSSYKAKMEDCLENTIVDKLSDCDNLTFLGWADANNNFHEAVFQIKNYETLYLRLCKDNNNGITTASVTVQPAIRITSTANLTTVNSFVNVQYGGSPSTLISANANNAQFDFWMITKDKENNKKDLQVLWQPKAPGQVHSASQGIILGTSMNNRDYIGIIGASNNGIIIYFLDDTNITPYYIPMDLTGYSDNSKVFKMNWMPITSTGALTTTVDNCELDFVKIFNSKLGAVEVSNTGNNKDSAEIRKLIQIGNDYYRQIVTCYWVKDPKGDETPITLTNIT